MNMHAVYGGIFALISGKYDHLLPKVKNGRIFLDLDAKWVEPLINLAQDITMWDGIDDLLCPLLSCDPLFSAGMNAVQDGCRCLYSSQSNIFDSEILKAENLNMDKEIHDWLDVDVSISSKLLYRCSRDGFNAKAFHAKCDGYENTITLIRDTEGCVFGGYLDIAWKSRDEWASSSKTFLFSLKRGGTAARHKFCLKESRQHAAVYFHNDVMPLFGNDGSGNYGIYIYIHESDRNRKSSSSLLEAYDNASGVKITSLANDKNFQVSEIEIFELSFDTS